MGTASRIHSDENIFLCFGVEKLTPEFVQELKVHPLCSIVATMELFCLRSVAINRLLSNSFKMFPIAHLRRGSRRQTQERYVTTTSVRERNYESLGED